ncbi:pheA operon leader peptide PheL [Salmonella enterica subsp. enterica serovar Infantis]|nr:pheA operon leader peptide PheL [Salmonella enterica subsp. enterica serovar Infantis]
MKLTRFFFALFFIFP